MTEPVPYWRATTWGGRTIHLLGLGGYGRAICGRLMHVRVEPGNGYDAMPECVDCRRKLGALFTKEQR